VVVRKQTERRARSALTVVALVASTLCAATFGATAPAAAAVADPLPLDWVHDLGAATLRLDAMAATNTGDTLLAVHYTGGASSMTTATGPYALAADSGGHGQVAFVRLTPAGTVIGVTTIGSASGDDSATAVAQASNGDFIALVHLAGTTPIASSPPSTVGAGDYLVRVTPAGSILWARALLGVALAVDATGISVISNDPGTPGWFGAIFGGHGQVDRVRFDGTVAWTRKITGNPPFPTLGPPASLAAVAIAPDGSTVVAGGAVDPVISPDPAAHSTGGVRTGVVARFDSAGALVGLVQPSWTSDVTSAVVGADGLTRFATALPSPFSLPTTAGSFDVAAGTLNPAALVALDDASFAGGPPAWAVRLDTLGQPPGGAMHQDDAITINGDDVVVASVFTEFNLIDGIYYVHYQWLQLTEIAADGSVTWTQEAMQRTQETETSYLMAPAGMLVARNAAGAVTVSARLNGGAKITALTFGNDNQAMTVDPSRWAAPLAGPTFVARYGPATAPRYDLHLTGTVSPPSIGELASADVELTVTNTGPATAPSVQVASLLPAGLAADSATASSGTVSGNIWTIPQLAVGESATVTVTTTAPTGSTCGPFSWSPFAASPLVGERDERDNRTDVEVEVAPPDAGEASLLWRIPVERGPQNGLGVQAIDVGPGGEVVTSGVFNGTIEIGKGAAAQTLNGSTAFDSLWIARHRADGTPLTPTQVDGDTGASTIAALPDGGWVVAATYKTTLVAKTAGVATPLAGDPPGWQGTFVIRFARDGSVRWAHATPTPDGWIDITDFAVDSSGDILVSGRYNGTVDLPAAGGTAPVVADRFDAFVSRYRSDGTPVSTWTAGDAGALPGTGGWEVATAVVPMAGGEMVVVGDYQGSITFGSGAGPVTLTSTGYAEGYVARVDAAGNLVWVQSMRGTGAHVTDPAGAAASPGGRVVVLSEAAGTVTFGPGGTSSATVPGTYGSLLVQYGGDGSVEWSEVIAGSGFVHPFDLDVSVDGVVSAGFQFDADISMGSGPLAVTYTDAGPYRGNAVAQFAPDGSLRWSRPVTDATTWLNLEKLASKPLGGMVVASGSSTATWGAQRVCGTPFDVAVTSFADPTSGRIAGVVQGPGGQVADGVAVSVFDRHPGWHLLVSTTTAADGSYSVSDLPSGTYRVRFFDPRGRFATRWWSTRPTYPVASDVTVSSGAVATVDAALPARPAGAITGTVRDASSGGVMPNAAVQVFSGFGYVGTAVTDAVGHYRLGGLYAGTYWVRVVDGLGRFSAVWFDRQPTGATRTPVTLTTATTVVVDPVVG